MIVLFINKTNNYILHFSSIRGPPIYYFKDIIFKSIKLEVIMKKYFNTYKEMISLRGLTDHTIKSYSTYIKAYLDYLKDILNKNLKMLHGMS
jgi:hypothetical protein